MGVITPDYYRHPKIQQAARRSRIAVSLDVACICWCAEHLTDGIIDHHDIYTLLPYGRDPIFRAIRVLEKVKRLVIFSSTQWSVHGFLEHNPTREQAIVRRMKATERQRRSRANRADLSRRDDEFWQWVESDKGGVR